jgi:hypothetical protein
MMVINSTECKNCNRQLNGKYCSNCGQNSDVKRYTISDLTSMFLHGFLHVNSGLLFTMKELFIHPGATLRGYIEGKRIKYINPFTYLVLISLVGGFLYNQSGFIEHVNETYLASDETINFTHKHYSYRLLLAVPIYALISWIMFKSFKYYLAEHLIINIYIISQSIIFLTAWFFALRFLKPDQIGFERIYTGGIVSLLIYQVVALYDLFNIGNKTLRWIKSTLVVVSGFGLSLLCMNLLAKILDRS